MTSKALHSSCKTFPKHIGNISAHGSAVATLWECCMSVVGKFLKGCLKTVFTVFSSASHYSHCLPLSHSCQSHLTGLQGVSLNPPHPFSIWIALHRNTHAQTDTYLTRPPIYHFDTAYGLVDLDQWFSKCGAHPPGIFFKGLRFTKKV